MKAATAVTTSWPALRVDRPTFSAVAESELDAVHRYLLFLTGNRTVAEDLTGETFEKAFRVWRRFDPRRGTPRAWLCSIARTTALDHFRSEERRRRREERYSRDVPETEEPAIGTGDLEAALARLSAAEREVVALRVLLALVSAAVIHGVVHSGGGSHSTAALQKLDAGAHRSAPGNSGTATTPVFGAATSPSDALASPLPTPTSGRYQDYQASLTVRVKNVETLHNRTAEATQVARSFGGYVASVDESTHR